MESDRSIYSKGETVQISLRVENVSPLPIEVHMPSPFEIRDPDGARVWASEFVSDRESQTLLPGEVLILTTPWDQTNTEERQVPDGTYRIYNLSRTAGSGAYADSVSFEILK